MFAKRGYLSKFYPNTEQLKPSFIPKLNNPLVLRSSITTYQLTFNRPTIKNVLILVSLRQKYVIFFSTTSKSRLRMLRRPEPHFLTQIYILILPRCSTPHKPNVKMLWLRILPVLHELHTLAPDKKAKSYSNFHLNIHSSYFSKIKAVIRKMIRSKFVPQKICYKKCSM